MLLKKGHNFYLRQNNLFFNLSFKILYFAIQLQLFDASFFEFLTRITLIYLNHSISFFDIIRIVFLQVILRGSRCDLSFIKQYCSECRFKLIEAWLLTVRIRLVQLLLLVKNILGPGGFEPGGLGNRLVLPLGQIVNFIACFLLTQDDFNLQSLWHKLQLQICRKAYYYIVTMSYRQYQPVRPNQTYNSIREQLERETQGLIQERTALNVQRPSANYVPSYRNLQQPSGRGSHPVALHKKNQIKNKIKEIIDLCKDQNASVTKDIAGMTEAEKGIYNLLQQTDMEGLPTSYAPPQAPTENYTPIRGPEDTGKNLQRDIRSIIEHNPQVHLSQEALQLINEIERRALSEIEKLRDEKLALINQLNDEIRRHNAEKKRSAQLERQLQFYRKGQGAGSDGRYENQLRARVAYLESQLRQTQSRENFKGDLQDFQALFAQGEAIRQETLRLLRLKEAKGYSDDAQKRRLKEQIQRLQRRVEQLQSQRLSRPGKPSYQVINEEYSPIAESRKHRDSYRNSANEYESLVMQMRKITSG